MRKIVVYLAVSADGYIAAEHDRVDWLEQVQTEGDAGYSEFYNSIDTVILGRRTYDWICENAPEYPYKDKESYLLTTGEPTVENPVTVVRDVEKLVQELRQKEGKDVWVVGGGRLIAGMLQKGLVDELRMTVAPVLLGSGVALFPEKMNRTWMKLEKVVQYGQFVELDYSIQK